MNVRKPTDYSAMFAALDELMAANLPQMELYRGIGCIVSGRPEKGAAVAAAEYLQDTYPDAAGFSPRSLRRMRDFYRTYESTPQVMAEAMNIGWTQNVVIMCIIRYILQILLRVAIENQVGVTYRIIVNQVVQCRPLIHIVCDFILNSDAVNRNHAAIGKF